MDDFEDEEAWLRYPVMRLRAMLRYVKSGRVETGLREIIGETENRLDMVIRRKDQTPPQPIEAPTIPR
jgi:hypothetical protein